MWFSKVGVCYVFLLCAVAYGENSQYAQRVQGVGSNTETFDLNAAPNKCATVGLNNPNDLIQINISAQSVSDSAKKIIIILRDEQDVSTKKPSENDDEYFIDVRLRKDNAPIVTTPTFRSDYNYYPGFGFYKYHTPATWPEARKICRDEGAHLPIVDTEEKARFLINIYNQNPRPVHVDHPEQIHIGMHDMFIEGDFVTIFDEPLSSLRFTRWAPGNPSNSNGNEHCGTLRDSIDLNDFPCTRQKISFICEKRFDKMC